jgi:hypothetical protein
MWSVADLFVRFDLSFFFFFFTLPWNRSVPSSVDGHTSWVGFCGQNRRTGAPLSRYLGNIYYYFSWDISHSRLGVNPLACQMFCEHGAIIVLSGTHSLTNIRAPVQRHFRSPLRLRVASPSRRSLFLVLLVARTD